MDIILINSIDFVYENKLPDLGQLILRDILKSKYQVDYINFDYLNYIEELPFKTTANENIEQFSKYILKRNPKVVGFYTICNSFYITLKVAEAIKRMNSGVKIVLGGPHATMTAESCLRDFAFIDVIALGEAEKMIMTLMDQLMGDGDLRKVPGIAYRDMEKVIINKSYSLLANEELIDYNVYDYSPFSLTEEVKLDLEVGRGCPFSCTFCSTNIFWGRKFRIKPVLMILEQMKKLNRLYGVTKFSLIHDLFTANKQVVHEFCNILIDENLQFEWDCSSRIDVLDKETILLMHKANCKGIFLGIETGSERMQEVINKRLDLKEALNMISIIANTGMRVTTSFIYGFPDETIEDFRKTVKMMEDCRRLGLVDLQLHRFMVLPETADMYKVKEKLYFDEEDINLSIYDRRIYNHEAINMIKKYQDVFVQYYTFRSDVREQYKRFDFFHSIMTSASSIFDCSIDYTLKKFGWELLYEKYWDKVEKLYELNKSFEVEQNREKKYKFVSESCKFAKEILEEVAEKDGSEYLHKLLDFETTFFNFCEGDSNESEYYCLSFDVLEAKRTRRLVDKNVYIKFVNVNSMPRIIQYKRKNTLLSS